MDSERVRLDAGGVSVTAAIHGHMPAGKAPPPKVPPASERDAGGSTSVARTAPGTLLAHGAGGDLDGTGLVALATTIAAVAGPVVRVNLPYREADRRLPPRAEASVDAFRAIRASAAELLGVDNWVVGGKSYGGRVASLAVAAGMPAVGLVFYGYPLHPPGRPGRLRVDHWPKINVPCLFLQGDRDPHCDLGLLEAHLDHLGGRAELHVVEGADHSLRISKAANPEGVAVGEDQVISALGPVVGTWYAGVRAAAS
jgi:uncharacterized protein